MIIYEGPSQLDGETIVGVLTGLQNASTNRKTGPMAQLWILRADTNPIQALRDGTDVSVCGNCSLRGVGGKQRGCYVSIGQAPHIIWKRYNAGKYRKALKAREIIPHLAGRRIRLGAYGDPAALPSGLLRKLVKIAARHTGYTHQWRDYPHLKDILMASVKSAEEAKEAQAKGWRTYRIVESFTDIDEETEMECLNTTKKMLCFECTLCDGNQRKAKSIAIEVHGGDGAEGFVFENQTKEVVWER